MPNPAAYPHCDFCHRPREDVRLLFRAEHGGTPPFICDECATGFAELAKLHRDDPKLAGRFVAEHNAVIERDRKRGLRQRADEIEGRT